MSNADDKPPGYDRSDSHARVERLARSLDPSSEPDRRSDDATELSRLVVRQEEEIRALRIRLRDAPKRLHAMEKRLVDAKSRLARASARNTELDTRLREARDRIVAMRSEIDRLTRPPNRYGVVLGRNSDGTLDVHVHASGRKMRLAVHPDVSDELGIGDEVVLNDSFTVILARRPSRTGEVLTVTEVLDDASRAVVVGLADEERVVELGAEVASGRIRSGDSVLVDTAAALVIERLPRPQVEAVVLEEIPEVSYRDVGGLDSQIEQITDAVELPFAHRDLFAEYDLPAPKGVLLYGPPGCGKTLIAKAVANSLTARAAEISGEEEARSCFLNIKGPELLNKYVGETERQIRLVFRRAREKSEQGWPVIVFFDEMESLFRTRGSGISSDIESTIVPQLLAEIDGVESLRNVIVIGASNREDLIDPAILRPGRLDVKIKIDRPDPEAAAAIFSRYLTTDLPMEASTVDIVGGGDPDKAVRGMIEQTVEDMYSREDANRFLEVTYANGDKEVMHFCDFASGAMIENVVRRAKKLAIKREIAGGERGICIDDLLRSVRREFKEHEDLPNTTNPDDWARISGKKGDRIVFVRTLVSDSNSLSVGGRSIERVRTGQYL